MIGTVVGSARRRLELVNVSVEPLPGGPQLARVHLWRRGPSANSGEKFVGKAEGVDAVRASAEAALDALRQAQPDALRLENLVSVETFEALGSTLVGASLSAYHGGELRLLMGFCRVRGYEHPVAAARAVLDATNRFLGDR